MGWRKLHSKLMVELQKMSGEIESARLLKLLQDWLKASRAEIGKKLRLRYGLDEFADMDLSQFPTGDSGMSALEEVHQLRTVPPVSMETLVMRVRDVFWSGVTVESGIQCPRCNSAELRVLREVDSEELVLECERCTWAQTLLGEPWSGLSRLVPPTSEQLGKRQVHAARP